MKNLKIPLSKNIKKGWDDFSTFYINTLEAKTFESAKSFFHTLTSQHMLASSPGMPQNSSVLEIACGSGRFAEMLLSEHPSSICDLHLVDISTEMVKFTTDRLSQLIHERSLDFTIGELDLAQRDKRVFIQELNAEDLSCYPDECFDVVVGSLVIHLAENPERMLAEVKRVLKPYGRAMFSVLADYQESSFFSVKTDLMREFGDQHEFRSIFHLENQELLGELFADFTILGFQHEKELIPITESFGKVLGTDRVTPGTAQFSGGSKVCDVAESGEIRRNGG